MTERTIPADVQAVFAESARYFPSPIQMFQFFDKYSRWDEVKGRRETWIETVDRSVEHLRWLSQDRLDEADYRAMHRAILEMQAMPSMRLLATAGPAARRTQVAPYNCSYLGVDSVDAFAEAMFISMSGCGVGFSVESLYTNQIPAVVPQTGLSFEWTVPDTSEGWAETVRFCLQTWVDGHDVTIDYSQVRPAGAVLRTKGGRASGPEPLRNLLTFARTTILAAQGRHLTPLECHDIMCEVGQAAVSGGHRRCLPKGTRIHTDRGAVPIEEVEPGDRVMTADGYRDVTGWVDQGEQDLVEVRTESGTIFRCTPNHRVAVLDNAHGGFRFKAASDLVANDRLMFISRPIDGAEQSLLPLPEKRESDHSGGAVKQPVLDSETAWFMGLFFADGHVSTPPHDARGKGGNTHFNVAISTGSPDIERRVRAWMESHGLHVSTQNGNGQWKTLCSQNRQIARWMLQYKQANTPLVVPEAVWRSDQSTRAAFLAGLMDGDGTFGDRPTVVVSTIYEDFARQVVKLLATLGIVAECRQRRPANERGWKAIQYVSVKYYLAKQRLVSLLSPYTSGTFPTNKGGKQSGYTVPREMVLRDLPRQDYFRVWAYGQGSDMNSATLTTLTKSDFFVPVKVTEVVSTGQREQTYDIEVADGHMFVAEGYLVHNTAMISLFDQTDEAMLHCKDGDFDTLNSQRWNANNSAVWEGITREAFDVQWDAMVASERGEPGIFNREATRRLIPQRRQALGYDNYGTNPCGEIVLRDKQFCNLTIVVARQDDRLIDLVNKVKMATLIGTIQSMSTNFHLLRPEWQKNCEEERLLGVDITGQLDCPLLYGPDGHLVMQVLKEVAIETNREYAALLGIPQSAAVTTVKPSGNSSQLLNCSSGLHARWAPYYIRNIRVSATSPLLTVLQEFGVPMDPENGQTPENANTWVIHFPVKSPDGAITRKDRTAIQQCEYWLRNKLYWTEHNPSVTITYKPDEIEGLRAWVWEHKDLIGGMAFLPSFDAQYDQLPYIDISEEEYERQARAFPKIDWSFLYTVEHEDWSDAAQELSCMSGTCDTDGIAGA